MQEIQEHGWKVVTSASRLLERAELVPDVYSTVLYALCFAFGAEGGFLSTDGGVEYFDMVAGNYRSLRIGKKGGIKIWEYNLPQEGQMSITSRNGIRVYTYKSKTSGWLVGICNPVDPPDQHLIEYILISARVAVKHIRKREYSVEGRDKLTGLLDRGSLFRDLQHLMKVSVNKGIPLYVMFIDLNNFKAVNDILGHRMGDRVLISIAHEIRNQVRGIGNVYRYGGDEFVVVVVGLAENVVQQLARRVELASEQAPGGISISASVGVEKYDGTRSIEEFISRADKKMYIRKKILKAEKKAG
jgi:diguanylate cyclase (GGDEF)-like protein